MIAYTKVLNVLDYVSIVISVTFADPETHVFDHTYVPMNDVDEWNWKACKRLILLKPIQCYVPNLWRVIDDPEKYHGAPAAIQLLGRRLEEDQLLSIAKLLADALGLS